MTLRGPSSFQVPTRPNSTPTRSHVLSVTLSLSQRSAVTTGACPFKPVPALSPLPPPPARLGTPCRPAGELQPHHRLSLWHRRAQCCMPRTVPCSVQTRADRVHGIGGSPEPPLVLSGPGASRSPGTDHTVHPLTPDFHRPATSQAWPTGPLLTPHENAQQTSPIQWEGCRECCLAVGIG